MQESNSLNQLNTCQTEHQNLQLSNQFDGNKSHNFYSFNHQTAISIMCKIIKRNYSRHFIKSLTFAYIQSLRKLQIKQKEAQQQTVKNIDWPFRSLLFKKNRNQNQQEMLQFVHHCATLIQSNFKAYITRKRHLIAIKKAYKTKDLLQSFMTRWKVYRVYNCQKIVLIRNKIKQIQKQIQMQQQNFSSRDAKKLKFLYKCYESNNKSFKNQFDVLMEDGAWILQKNMKPLVKMQIPKQTIPKSRDFSQRNNIIKPSFEKKEQPIQFKKQNISMNYSPQINSKLQNKSTTFSEIEERPIKAAGQYKYNQNDEFAHTSNLDNNNYNNNNNLQQFNDSNNQNQNKKKDRIKKQNELQKRKKYDPRKAIQEQKKKKKQMKQLETIQNISQTENKTNNTVSKQQNITSKKIESKSKLQQKKEKKLQKYQSQQIKNKQVITKKQKNSEAKIVSKNSKHTLVKKISSKVDCWVGKKEQQPDWVKQYKLRMLQQNKIQDDQEQRIKKNINQMNDDNLKKQKRKSLQTQQIQNNKQVIRQMEKIEEERERESRRKKNIAETWQSNQRQFEKLREKHMQNVNKRKNSMQNSQSMARLRMQRQFAPRKKQLHRSIQELEQTYNKQYLNRLQNLMPRLSLLSVSRKQNGKVPVVDQQNQQFGIWFQQLSTTNQFWKKFNEHQKIYEAFIFS